MLAFLVVHSLAICFGLLFLGVLTSACSSSKPTPAPPPRLRFGRAQAGSCRQGIMHDMIDRCSDNIFNGSDRDEREGTVETEPKTDEDWEKIQIGAVAMRKGIAAQGSPALHAARRPEQQHRPGRGEIVAGSDQAKLDADPVEWNARVEALRNVGLEVLDIVKRKDVKELWDAGYNLDEACENCHKSYCILAKRRVFIRGSGAV